MKYIFEITWACWLLSEILLNRLLRAKNSGSGTPDKNSMNLIWAAITVSMTAGILAAIYLPVPIISNNFLLYKGTVLVVLGMLIRFFAVRRLGRFFTVDLAVHDDQQLVTGGLYAYLRHPSYAGSLLSFAGFAMSLNNWISLFAITLPVFLAFRNRMHIEEKMLLQKFGTAYEAYMKTTKRIIPFIY